MDAISGPVFLRAVLDFGRELKAEGLTVDLATVLDYARALELVDIGDREEVRAAGAALFVRRREQLEPYDLAFARFWRRRVRQSPLATPELRPSQSPRTPEDKTIEGDPEAMPPSVSLRPLSVDHQDDHSDDSQESISPTSYSARETLRTKSFERMTTEELRDAQRAIDEMVLRVPMRRTRRWELDSRGTLLAPRAMMRRNLSTGGDPLDWVWRRPLRRPRDVVLLCDISGSMERFARLLLRFGHAMTRSRVHTESFAFGTRLTRITHQLKTRDPDAALRLVSAAVGDWSGGTRIGSAFRDFNLHWARRVLRSSGLVIVVSDGWDRGDPRLVAEETARLRRNAHTLIWLNPLAGAADYQPLAAGMAAAYPHIDRLLPAHDLASLERLAEILSLEAFSRTSLRAQQLRVDRAAA
jgi:uncharacterized protein with von Willebrand factor type A (vWA) domain